MKFVVIGLTITSEWSNSHANTYRTLLKELHKKGHDILFLEKDLQYYAANRDLPIPTFCHLGLYKTKDDLKKKYEEEVATADVVIVGSYVKDGVDIGRWVIETAQGITAFYDIDTPVTLYKLEREDYAYINPELIASYNLYLSSAGGPILQHFESYYSAPFAKVLYPCVDPDVYFPTSQEFKWQMGYLENYNEGLKPALEDFLNKPAKALSNEKFALLGSKFPEKINWSANIESVSLSSSAMQRDLYNRQRFTLHLTDQNVTQYAYKPSVKLFEAAACGVPIISNVWEGLSLFFEEYTEILIAHSTEDVIRYISGFDEDCRLRLGEQARNKVLKYHTVSVRAEELEEFVFQAQQIQRNSVQKSLLV